MRGNTLGFGQEICVNTPGGCVDKPVGSTPTTAAAPDLERADGSAIFASCSRPTLLCGVLTVVLVGSGVGVASWYLATM